MRGRKNIMPELAALFSEGRPFSALGETARQELLSNSEIRSFRKGHYLFHAGSPVEGILAITSGLVRITQPQVQREVVVRLAAPGEWVGHRSIFTSDSYRGSAQAKENTTAVFVPTAYVLKLFGSSRAFADLLIRMVARDLESTERLLFEYRKLNVPSRLISLFRVLDEKIGKPGLRGRTLSAKLTKVEIAEMIGASQEVVSRQLSKWKKENLLHEENKRIVLSKILLNRVIR